MFNYTLISPLPHYDLIYIDQFIIITTSLTLLGLFRIFRNTLKETRLSISPLPGSSWWFALLVTPRTVTPPDITAPPHPPPHPPPPPPPPTVPLKPLSPRFAFVLACATNPLPGNKLRNISKTVVSHEISKVALSSFSRLQFGFQDHDPAKEDEDNQDRYLHCSVNRLLQ